ncbi:cytidylate kinase family protein [Desulfomonile tiedjei]|uniref:Cytidylate kinase n=1 Tax=Desulfomonile tiedjei (strain ATCC 49306 / DSM 6799 / DCB-1) TaxID=706587 RepID=I4C5S7_DESTA|nr:cytidylate kinase family protein [Desulfomonile tiedjei]AFM24918.1 cytidylate kinase [Desulfomonile tiedjei DSM 6799]
MNIITVSRLVGSYGDDIASKVAEKMGLEFVGRTGLHELAMSCDLEYREACTLYETEHGPGFFERLFFDRPSHKSLFEALTYEQAGRGNVVMVGRGAQIVLHDLPGVFCVGVIASRVNRVQRIMQKLGIPLEEAEYYVDKYDAERITLIKTVFDKDPTDLMLYNLLINTDHYTAENAADVIVHAIGKMDKRPDGDQLVETLKNMALAKRIEALVRRKLTSAVAGNVEISAEPGGVIRISGRIREKADRARVEKIAAEYSGVTQVVNELKVTDLTFRV